MANPLCGFNLLSVPKCTGKKPAPKIAHLDQPEAYCDEGLFEMLWWSTARSIWDINFERLAK
jgi:hypothetical protein